MANIEKDEVSGTPTTGHEWDGIKELDTPMPRWWVWTFYATIAFAVAYWVVYPSWPILSDHWKGTSGYTARKELAQDLDAQKAERAQWTAKFATMSTGEIAKDQDLLNYAMAGGKVIFAENCAPCHGSQGSGAPAYPVLADDDWIWGGSLSAIEETIRVGARSSHDDTRISDMPAFGADELLERDQIKDLAEFVLAFTKRETDADAASRGADLFQEECASCHGDQGEGLRESGAPRLNDGIWLYGGEKADIVNQISRPRHGVMPTWAERLEDVSIKQVAIYVHSLGGGE